MKFNFNFKSTISLLLGILIILSAVITPINIFTVAAENVITLNPGDFTLTNASNCTIEGNKVISTNNQYPQFKLNFNNEYYIEKITITATLVTKSYFLNEYVSMLSDGIAVSAVNWGNHKLKLGETGSVTKTVLSEYQTTAFEGIQMNGMWSSKPAAGAASMTIEKIEIVESKVLKPSALKFNNITDSAVDVEWTLQENQAADVWYSTTPIDESNVASAQSIATGTQTSAKVENLSENTLYYFAIKVSEGEKIGWHYSTVTTLLEEEPEKITFEQDDFTLSNAINSSISDYTVNSTKSTEPQFDISLDAPYYIKGVKITASANGNTFVLKEEGLQLFFEGEKLGSAGKNTDFVDGVSQTTYFAVDESLHTKCVDSFRLSGEWFNLPVTAGSAKITVEKVEIIGKAALIAPELTFVNITGTSLDVSWELPANASVELWYSENNITSANFDTITEKTMVADGEINSATATDLTPRKTYYFILKIMRDDETVYSTSKIYPQALDDEIIILDGEDITLTRKSNCTVSGNTMTSTANQYPQFYLELPTTYYIESVTITGTVTDSQENDKNYYLVRNGGVTLYSDSTSVQTFGKNDFASIFSESTPQKQFTMNVSEANQTKAINRISFATYWNSTPSSGQVTLTIDKVEIKGYSKVEETELKFDKFTKTSVNVNWENESGNGVKLWLSDTEINADNFDTLTNKTLVASGRINSAECTGLTNGETYYFALEIFNGTKKYYVFDSFVLQGMVYDFEQSTVLKDYSSKVKSNWYHINGGYGCTASIVETEEYSDTGNAFKMDFGTWTGYRWPIMRFYAPNWADFSGEGISITVGKSLNHLGADITASCRVQLEVDGYGIFNYKNDQFNSTMFPKGVSKQTLEYDYEDFVSTSDSSIKMTPEMSQHITTFQIWFNVPESVGQFSLYFDSIKVINPIKITREVESISFQSDKLFLAEGSVTSQEAVYSPYNATENDFVWSSSEPQIVNVDSVTGKISTLTFGSAYITATAPNGVNKSYKVVVRQDTRGMQFKDLFVFDDGSIPEELTVSGAKAELDYVKVDKDVSLYIKSDSKNSVATFVMEDNAFYGNGITFWSCGTNEKTLKISLVTKSGKTFSTTVNTDVEDGLTTTLDYSDFKESGNGLAPTILDIIDFNKLIFSYNGSIYLDSIKVVDPMILAVESQPVNSIENTEAVLKDDKNALGENKYYLTLLESGTDYNLATEALKGVGLIDFSGDASVYSLYFVDKNFNQIDLEENITVTTKIPMALEGMNNIWILRIADGKIIGVTAHISGDEITFEAKESGLYCMIAGRDDDYLAKKVKSSEEIKIMTSGGTEPTEVTKTVETVMRKKGYTKQVGNSYLWILWIVIPIAVLVVGGIVTIIIIKKKRKA